MSKEAEFKRKLEILFPAELGNPGDPDCPENRDADFFDQMMVDCEEGSYHLKLNMMHDRLPSKWHPGDRVCCATDNRFNKFDCELDMDKLMFSIKRRMYLFYIAYFHTSRHLHWGYPLKNDGTVLMDCQLPPEKFYMQTGWVNDIPRSCDNRRDKRKENCTCILQLHLSNMTQAYHELKSYMAFLDTCQCHELEPAIAFIKRHKLYRMIGDENDWPWNANTRRLGDFSKLKYEWGSYPNTWFLFFGEKNLRHTYPVWRDEISSYTMYYIILNARKFWRPDQQRIQDN